MGNGVICSSSGQGTLAGCDKHGNSSPKLPKLPQQVPETSLPIAEVGWSPQEN